MKAPPTARALASTPAIRSARITTALIAKRRRTKPVVPAVAGSMRRYRRGVRALEAQWVATEPTITSTITVPIRIHWP